MSLLNVKYINLMKNAYYKQLISVLYFKLNVMFSEFVLYEHLVILSYK